LTAVADASSLNSTHVSMTFGRSGSEWDVQFTVVNGTTQPVEKTVMMSKELTRQRQLDESFKPYFESIQCSIFAVRDMDYGVIPKYLVVGAPWNIIFVSASSVTVRVTSEARIQPQA